MSRKLASILVFLTLLVPCASGCASREPATLHVLTYNIHQGEGMDRRLDLERIAKVIREAKPDLVAFQEVDRGAERTRRVDEPAGFASFTFPADAPASRIDYVLCNSCPSLTCVGYRIIPEAVASDHRPVLAVFRVAWALRS
ncbi:MAG: endonuclease/exonuclease/phosphatase family protein [Phycisphaerae bacterium]